VFGEQPVDYDNDNDNDDDDHNESDNDNALVSGSMSTLDGPDRSKSASIAGTQAADSSATRWATVGIAKRRKSDRRPRRQRRV